MAITITRQEESADHLRRLARLSQNIAQINQALHLDVEFFVFRPATTAEFDAFEALGQSSDFMTVY